MRLNRSYIPLFGPLSGVLNGSNPIVKNAQNQVSYHGVTENGIDQFHNIFYAEDTSGPNRFAPPVPYTPPPGTVVDATTPGAWCPQATGGPPLPFTSEITNVSENCLSLRIARISGTEQTAKLPVLVWIHGGGDALGSASDQLYTPDGLLHQANANLQPVIYVGINYRLGIFGFANMKALEITERGNVGLRDQRAAFEWVHDNIAVFGGDPDNVVAVGQSVGAASIALHLVSYAGKRGVPFQKAMMMSGASGTNFNIMSNLVANNTATVANSVGCTQSNSDPEATLDCLRSVPLEKLMNTSVDLARSTRPPFGELAFYPSFDGDYIPTRPSLLLRQGSFVKGIPIIGSWVANDGAWYVPPTITDDASVIASFSTFVLGLSHSSLQTLLALYPESDFTHLVRPGQDATAQYYRAAQMNRDIWFTCPVIDFTWQYTRHGGSNVRLYDMNQTKFGPIFHEMGVPQWRVSHLSDIPYFMNENVTFGADNSPAQIKLSGLVSGSAAAFAHTGDPTYSSGQALSYWPGAYEGQNDQALNSEYPEALNLYVVGGPYGSGSARVLNQAIHARLSKLEQALAWENVIERCRFINSIHDQIGV